MPVFFIPSPRIIDGTLSITGPLLDHLRKSLRVELGEELWVADPQRRRYCLRVTCITSHELRGTVLAEQSGPPREHPTVALGQALLKGDRMDWVIQKATELGVASIVPLVSERVIVRPRMERLTSQQERWRRIGLEAAQQAECWDLPELPMPVEFRTWLPTVTSSLKLILSERTGSASLADVALPQGAGTNIVLLVGPEGGWTQAERDTAQQYGFAPINMGPRILRAETAALAAMAILQSRLGELG